MKENTKLTVLLILTVIGIALLLWGNYIMMNYDGFREVWKEARNAALPQSLIGIVVLVGAYILTYTKIK
jgi:hypothetical protein